MTIKLNLLKDCCYITRQPVNISANDFLFIFQETKCLQNVNGHEDYGIEKIKMMLKPTQGRLRC